MKKKVLLLLVLLLVLSFAFVVPVQAATFSSTGLQDVYVRPIPGSWHDTIQLSPYESTLYFTAYGDQNMDYWISDIYHNTLFHGNTGPDGWSGIVLSFSNALESSAYVDVYFEGNGYIGYCIQNFSDGSDPFYLN